MTEEEIRAAFDEKYPPHHTLYENYPELWDLCCDAATTPDILTGIRFANDWLSVPPVKSFLLCSQTRLHELYGPTITFDDSVKRATGAFWGAVFKELLGYTAQRTAAITVPGMNFKTATVFQKKSASA